MAAEAASGQKVVFSTEKWCFRPSRGVGSRGVRCRAACADVVILAGDTGVRLKGIRWAQENFRGLIARRFLDARKGSGYAFSRLTHLSSDHLRIRDHVSSARPWHTASTSDSIRSLSFIRSWTTRNIVIIDPPENDQLTESPRETYEQWRQRKMRAEKNYPRERTAADRKRMNEDAELVKRALAAGREVQDLMYRLQHLKMEPELLAELQSEAKEIVQESTKQFKQRIMLVLLQNQVKNQFREAELEKRVEELTKSNQEISQKIELLLSFYTPALREKTMNELDVKAEAFVQKIFANRSRKRK